MRELTAEQFIKDIKQHRMSIIRQDGMYRHVHFRDPKTAVLWFELITWPGCLTINGDMGTWTFSRLPDMFDFFRGDKLRINPSYWAEKLRHGNFSGRDGAKVWDEDSFKERLLGMLTDHYGFEGEKLAEIREAVKEEIFSREGQWALCTAAYEFSHDFEDDSEKPGYKSNRDKFSFDGMDLPSGMVYSYHFIWCLYAIVWGIYCFDHGDEESIEVPA